MHAYTYTYLTETLGPSRAFKLLVEQSEIQDLVSKIKGKEIDKIIQVAKTLNDPRVTPLVRTICILLIHILGFGDSLITELMGHDTYPLVEKTVLRGLDCHPSPAFVKRQLHTLKGNPKIAPRTRILAAYMLIKLGSDPFSVNLTNVPGYPRPWNGAVPLPQDVRDAILRAYRTSMASGTDPALRIESERLGPSTYPRTHISYESDSEDKPKKSQIYDGVEIFGPMDCSTLHQQGGGTYHVYKIFTDTAGHQTQPADGT